MGGYALATDVPIAHVSRSRKSKRRAFITLLETVRDQPATDGKKSFLVDLLEDVRAQAKEQGIRLSAYSYHDIAYSWRIQETSGGKTMSFYPSEPTRSRKYVPR